jgi:hypothetical protein
MEVKIHVELKILLTLLNKSFLSANRKEMFPMDFSNKLIVFICLKYSYFTYDRGVRILLRRH